MTMFKTDRNDSNSIWSTAIAAGAIATVLIFGVYALGFASGYVWKGVSSKSDAGVDRASVDTPIVSPRMPSEPNSPLDREAKRKPIFDKEEEAHIEDLEEFVARLTTTVEDDYRPNSITQELINFIDFDRILPPEGVVSYSPHITGELNRYRMRFCSNGNIIEYKYDINSYWDIVKSFCLPPNWSRVGVSPEFALYWSRFGYESIDYDFKEFVPEQLYIALHQIQYEQISAIRSFLSQPDNLRHVFSHLKEDLSASLLRLAPDQRRALAERVDSAVRSATLVLKKCEGALCQIEAPDYSVSEDPFDTEHFTRRSPIRQLVDYDRLLDSEILELEFFVRRLNEGGIELVVAYRDILLEVQEMLNEPR